MKTVIKSSRIELHFPDGHIEIVRDLSAARRITRAQPDGQIRIWTVSSNDVGIGEVVDARRAADPTTVATRPRFRRRCRDCRRDVAPWYSRFCDDCAARRGFD